LHQRGVTLIEFMIGLTIGMLVVLAAVGSLTMLRSSARTMSDSASLEQQASLVMMKIGQQINQADTTRACADITCSVDTGSSTFLINSSAGVGPTFALSSPGTPIYGDIDTALPKDAAKYNPARFAVSYVVPSDNNIASLQSNCIGNTPRTPPPPAASSLKINVSWFRLNTSTNNLICGDGSNTPQPIASHVADMQVTYLMVDSGGNVTYRSDPSLITDWTTVNGVQVCLEMQGDPAQAPPLTNPNLKDCRGGNLPSDDGRIYRVVKQTFYLHNQS
jgi:type IV pilus assembly protein PilW